MKPYLPTLPKKSTTQRKETFYTRPEFVGDVVVNKCLTFLAMCTWYLSSTEQLPGSRQSNSVCWRACRLCATSLRTP